MNIRVGNYKYDGKVWWWKNEITGCHGDWQKHAGKERPWQAALREALALLERVGLKDRAEHKPYELSGGEQQRVAIARALINEPDAILADEPTGNLDSHTGQSIVDLLCEIQQERQATLIIATHDAHLADRAPRVIELVDGLINSDVLS